MDQYPGQRLVEEEIARHRETPDFDVDLRFGDVRFPNFYVRNGVLRPDTMTARPFGEFVWQNRAVYADGVVVDMMCGSGILGLIAAMSGARQVTLSDISPDAYLCSIENIRRCGLAGKVTPIQADLFDHHHFDGMVADVIICNAPFCSGVPDSDDYLAAAFLGGTELIHRFFAAAKSVLSPEGSILMPYRKSSGMVNDPGVQCLAHGFKIVDEQEVTTEYGVQFGGPLTFYRIMRV